MQLRAWLILAGGPGSGCEGPNCGRPKTGNIEKVQQERQEGVDKPLMILKVLDRMPILFDNDDKLNWKWTPDQKTLHIEDVDENAEPAGIKQTTVYDIPAGIVQRWEGGTEQDARA